MIAELCTGLARARHAVTLFTTGTSTCPVPRRHIYDREDPERMGAAIPELRHVAAAYDHVDEFDIVHDHTIAGPYYAQRFGPLPLVTTNHGPFDEDLADLYRRISDEVDVVAISHDQAARAPSGLRIARVIHHGIDLSRYPFGRDPDDYLAFLGRMSPDKGVDVAVRVARTAGVRLLIAAKMRERTELRFFRTEIRPHLGNGVEYIGEADFATKIDLLSNALALLNPITWPEPFGLAMIEALACGTPVVAYRCGSAPEIVEIGRTGFLADEEADLIRAVRRVHHLDRVDCRHSAEVSFSATRMVADHVELYREVIARHAPRSLVDDDLDLAR